MVVIHRQVSSMIAINGYPRQFSLFVVVDQCTTKDDRSQLICAPQGNMANSMTRYKSSRLEKFSQF